MSVKNRQLVFIDDSGDPGFRKASSAYLVMAAVVFKNLNDATIVNDKISELKNALGWRIEQEFKFSKSIKEIRVRFLRAVEECNFEIYAAFVAKDKYRDYVNFSDKEKLYDWTIKELLKVMPISGARVIVDGRSDKKNRNRMASYLRKEINKNRQIINKVRLSDSKRDNLIQLADMTAGAINRYLQGDKTDAGVYIRIISDKIVELRELDLN